LITLCPLTPLQGVSKAELVRMISFRFKRAGERELDLVWKERRGWMTNIFNVMLVNHPSWRQGFGGAQAGGCGDWFYREADGRRLEAGSEEWMEGHE
jgi:hypothetical protein